MKNYFSYFFLFVLPFLLLNKIGIIITLIIFLYFLILWINNKLLLKIRVTDDFIIFNYLLHRIKIPKDADLIFRLAGPEDNRENKMDFFYLILGIYQYMKPKYTGVVSFIYSKHITEKKLPFIFVWGTDKFINFKYYGQAKDLIRKIKETNFPFYFDTDYLEEVLKTVPQRGMYIYCDHDNDDYEEKYIREEMSGKEAFKKFLLVIISIVEWYLLHFK